MTTPSDPLDRPATLGRMHVVLDAASVPAASRAAVLDLAARSPDGVAWRSFLASALLVLGAGLVLSGVVSFFAFNWSGLSTFAKLGLIAAGVAACAGGALARPDTLLARVLLFGAAVLTGALLAVFGQAYQTGADPWGLFGAWALLILPWTVAAVFMPLWLLWLALVDVAYWLYVAQVVAGPRWDVTLLLGLLAVHVLALMAWELQAMRRRPWFTGTWAPRLIAAATLLPLVVPAVVVLIDASWSSRVGQVALAALAFLIVVVGVFHTAVRRDTFMLTIAAACVMAIVTTLVGRLLMVTLDLEMLGLLLVTGFIVLEATLVVTWLRRQTRGEAA